MSISNDPSPSPMPDQDHDINTVQWEHLSMQGIFQEHRTGEAVDRRPSDVERRHAC